MIGGHRRGERKPIKSMRYLILSDIHANQTALETALDAAKGRWERAVCLGDLVGYGPDPNEVIARVQELGAVTIRGNHDKAIGGVMEGDDFNPIAQFAVQWSREKLTAENQRYLSALPHGPKALDGFTFVHGALHDEDEYVFSPALAVDGLVNAPTPVIFFGHTHLQGGFSFRDDNVTVLHTTPTMGRSSLILPIETGTTYLLNPGSIGQPRDGDPRAAFAIFDTDSRAVEYWRVPYDIASVQARMVAAGLPEPLILRLTFGR
jgi:predicted phosphodiesterase